MTGQILWLVAALGAAAGIVLWQRWREAPPRRPGQPLGADGRSRAAGGSRGGGGVPPSPGGERARGGAAGGGGHRGGRTQRRSLALGEAVEARLAEEAARLEDASRRYAAGLAASPPLLPADAREAGVLPAGRRAGASTGDALVACPAEWVHHLVGGFKWGLLLGILAEAAGLGLLALVGRQVRGAGL